MDTSEIVSIVASVFSVGLAVFAIWQAQTAARESRSNYQDTKDVLAAIDKSSSVIQVTVTSHQKHLLRMIQQMLPQQPDAHQALGKEGIRLLANNPAELRRFLQHLYD